MASSSVDEVQQMNVNERQSQPIESSRSTKQSRKGKVTSEVWVVYYEILYCRVIPNVFTYNVLIHCLCKGGSLKSALDLLSIVEFDTVSYNTLIWGFCKEGLVKQVVGVLSKMIKKGVEIDSFTLNVLIKGFCRVGLLGNAELMMDQFVKVGIDRDIVKVNCV
ncbi:hypothetical protein GIB67_030140 [Kingdonia uniflora]|uniref:Pentatricopeptide repeat-containing protein n=1 Tax=Kingdonia uniflora TaxID=39325 RepID=A0A7J7L6X7_9MAGN|nr:hypothetical protein GIB67_030140 [Kingdonia uniflora]